MLRPGYKSPNQHQIRDNLLHNVFETEKNACREKLHNQIVCMSFNGVSNIHNESIISARITTEKGDTYLINSFDTSGNSHFSEYLMNIVETAIKNVEETFGCIVGSVITGAANMIRMRDLMKKPFFITSTYSAHTLNLLAKDLEIPEVTVHAIKVIKYFRNNHFAKAKFQELKIGKSLCMPQQVGWNTMCFSFASYIKN